MGTSVIPMSCNAHVHLLGALLLDLALVDCICAGNPGLKGSSSDLKLYFSANPELQIVRGGSRNFKVGAHTLRRGLHMENE